jgi:hypothetical protein
MNKFIGFIGLFFALSTTGWAGGGKEKAQGQT